jgi:hypothetical protein
VLEAGTYAFKLADSESDRDLVQVYNKGETHLYGTFLAITNQRLRPAGKPIITFEEAPVGSAEAVKAWFYPGDGLCCIEIVARSSGPTVRDFAHSWRPLV